MTLQDQSITNSSFSSSGSVILNETESNDLFVKLSSTIPFTASIINAYITSKVSKEKILDFNPTYFKIPYINSASLNLKNGKYTYSLSITDDLLINKYNIPYQGEVKEELVTIVTYYNIKTNILYYEIPRVFSYNSINQASVSIIQNGKNFIGKIIIPSSFISFNNTKINYILNLNINPTLSGNADISINQEFNGCNCLCINGVPYPGNPVPCSEEQACNICCQFIIEAGLTCTD